MSIFENKFRLSDERLLSLVRLLGCISALSILTGLSVGTSFASTTDTSFEAARGMARFADQISQSGDVLSFNLATGGVETPLRVPEPYIDRDVVAVGENQNAHLYLKMMWPSLERAPVKMMGARSAREFAKSQRLLDSGRYLGVEFHQGTLARMRADIADHISKDWLRSSTGSRVPGFDSYFDRLDLSHAPVTELWRETYLVPKDQAFTHRVYIKCPINSLLPATHVYCVGHNYLGHFVYGEYQFSYAHLDDWKMIDSSVRQLFALMSDPPAVRQPSDFRR